jgi:acyl-CoA reductase-like NAD-dependent aldehyde dehydrogenase
MGQIGEVIVQNFIGGNFIPIEKSNTIPSFNPATGTVWALIPDSTADDVDDAVKAASQAFLSWSKMGYEARSKYMLKIADRIDEQLEEFAVAESKDQGKPVSLARKMDIPRASYNFRKFGSAWENLVESSNSLPEQGCVNISSRHPLGVAGLISPWNLPLYLLTFKIAPAIMAGNTVVCKPSEMTSVTAWMLAKVIMEVGLPAGVVNIVFGTGYPCGQNIVTHPKVRMVSFTGSTAIGQKIAQLTAASMKKVSLELGGKNAAIIFNDANLDESVAGVTRSAFLNQGEICLCTSRIFVQSKIYDVFLKKFLESVKKLKTGDPLEEDTFTGAVNSAAHYDKVMSYVQFAVEDGGKIECGEGVSVLNLAPHNKKGYFIQPTVISGLDDLSRCMQDEIFGPVATISKFECEAEVIERVNNTRYGLCASVWSENVGTIHRMGQRLEVGTVWSNCWLVRSLDMPFGGCKESGSGREGTRHSLEAFTEEKTHCIKTV